MCWQLALRSCNLFASPTVVDRPRSDSLLLFEPQNIYQIRMGKQNASAWHLPPTALLEQWLQVCCVKITFTAKIGIGNWSSPRMHASKKIL